MAEDILSQQEVDALLRGVTSEPEQETPAPRGGVRAYDIGRDERIVRGRMPGLELINERFARLLRIGLFGFARREVAVSVAVPRVQKYDDFIAGLASPASLNVVSAGPLPGFGLFVMDAGLVFQMVETLFGGGAQPAARVEARDFTPTEQRVIRRLLSVVFEAYGKAWEPSQALDLQHVRSEVNARFISVAASSEVVVVTSIRIEFGNGSGGELHLCMPYSMLEPLRDIIHGSRQPERKDGDSHWASVLADRIQGAELELVATLARTTVTLREVQDLQVGDVIELDLPDAVEVDADGVPLMQCKYGVFRGQYALKVQRMLGGASKESTNG